MRSSSDQNSDDLWSDVEPRKLEAGNKDDFFSDSSIFEYGENPSHEAAEFTAPIGRARNLVEQAKTYTGNHKAVAGIVAGAVALGSIGLAYERATSDEVVYGSGQIEEYLWWEAPDHLESVDPAFRASGISLYSNGLKLGSGGLVKLDNGDVIFATVEHVARPFYEMQAMVDSYGNEGTTININESSDIPNDNRSYIEGIGLLSRSTELPKFYDLATGNPTQSSEEGQDRFATIPLTQRQELEIKFAEIIGRIDIPEVSKKDLTIGDIAYLVSPDTGNRIPLIYTGSEDKGKASFFPLIIASEELNEDAGRKKYLDRLNNELKIQEQKVIEHQDDPNYTYNPMKLSTLAPIIGLEMTFEWYETISHESRPISNKDQYTYFLGCHGDSGGLIVDGERGVIGTYSSGVNFPGGIFSGLYRDDNSFRSCLMSVEAVTIPSFFDVESHQNIQ